MGFENPVVGGTALRIPAIQSPNFEAGSEGWIIRNDGSAEFNDLSIRGTYSGNDFIINSQGLFIYDGTPAAGNLIASITPADGTDTFGNTVLGGITTYAGEDFTSLWLGNLNTGLIAERFQGGVVGLVGADGLVGLSPFTDTAPDQSSWQLQDGVLTTTPISDADYPHIMTMGTLWCNDPIIRANNNANVWTPETWQTPSFATSWAGTTTFSGVSAVQSLRYRRDGEDNVWLEGAFKATGAAASGVFTLPSGYFAPGEIHMFPVMEKQSGGTFQVGAGYVGTTGIFHIDLGANFTRNSGDAFYVDAKVPMGNID